MEVTLHYSKQISEGAPSLTNVNLQTHATGILTVMGMQTELTLHYSKRILGEVNLVAPVLHSKPCRGARINKRDIPSISLPLL